MSLDFLAPVLYSTLIAAPIATVAGLSIWLSRSFEAPLFRFIALAPFAVLFWLSEMPEFSVIYIFSIAVAGSIQVAKSLWDRSEKPILTVQMTLAWVGWIALSTAIIRNAESRQLMPWLDVLWGAFGFLPAVVIGGWLFQRCSWKRLLCVIIFCPICFFHVVVTEALIQDDRGFAYQSRILTTLSSTIMSDAFVHWAIVIPLIAIGTLTWLLVTDRHSRLLTRLVSCMVAVAFSIASVAFFVAMLWPSGFQPHQAESTQKFLALRTIASQLPRGIRSAEGIIPKNKVAEKYAESLLSEIDTELSKEPMILVRLHGSWLDTHDADDRHIDIAIEEAIELGDKANDPQEAARFFCVAVRIGTAFQRGDIDQERRYLRYCVREALGKLANVVNQLPCDQLGIVEDRIDGDLAMREDWQDIEALTEVCGVECFGPFWRFRRLWNHVVGFESFRMDIASFQEYQSETATFQLLKIAIHAQRYRCQTGAFPTSLEQISLEAKDLIDPFEPQQNFFRYEIDGDGYRVSSVGPIIEDYPDVEKREREQLTIQLTASESP